MTHITASYALLHQPKPSPSCLARPPALARRAAALWHSWRRILHRCPAVFYRSMAILGVRWGEKGGKGGRGCFSVAVFARRCCGQGAAACRGQQGSTAKRRAGVQCPALDPGSEVSWRGVSRIRAHAPLSHPAAPQRAARTRQTGAPTLLCSLTRAGTCEVSAARSPTRTTTHVCHAAHGHRTQLCTGTERSFAQTPPSGWVPGYSLTPKR